MMVANIEGLANLVSRSPTETEWDLGTRLRFGRIYEKEQAQTWDFLRKAWENFGATVLAKTEMCVLEVHAASWLQFKLFWKKSSDSEII